MLRWGRTASLRDERDRFTGAHRLCIVDGSPLPQDMSDMARVLQTGVPERNREVVVERPGLACSTPRVAPQNLRRQLLTFSRRELTQAWDIDLVEVGKKTTISVYLPPRSHAPVESVPVSSRPMQGRGERIFLMEDDEPLRTIARRFITKGVTRSLISVPLPLHHPSPSSPNPATVTLVRR
jgi:hypothetical protein